MTESSLSNTLTESLLKEEVPRSLRCNGKVRIVLPMFIGLGIAVLLSWVHVQPTKLQTSATNMAYEHRALKEKMVDQTASTEEIDKEANDEDNDEPVEDNAQNSIYSLAIEPADLDDTTLMPKGKGKGRGKGKGTRKRKADEYEEPLPDSEKTPVTVVTGFLGAGKTTLVNYILKAQHGKRIAVIENEFGAVNIDESLVSDSVKEKEDVFSMDNGCVCCTVRGDLIKTLHRLREKTEQDGTKFDAILLETTGLADPSPIVFTFNADQTARNYYRIDSILTLVDAKHIGLHLDEKKSDGSVNEATQQVAFADRILLNKLDLVTLEEKKAVRAKIRTINAFADMIETNHSQIDLNKILAVGSFSLDKVLEVNPDVLEEEESEEECHDPDCTDDHGHSHEHNHTHGHDHGHGNHTHGNHTHDHHHHHGNHTHGNHTHGHGHKHGHNHTHGHKHGNHSHAKKPKHKHNLDEVSSVGISLPGTVDFDKINDFVTGLLKTKAKDIFRMKGVLSTDQHGAEKMVFHGVHESMNFGESGKQWLPGEQRVCKFVFIGKGLDREYLETSFKNCLYTSPALPSPPVLQR